MISEEMALEFWRQLLMLDELFDEFVPHHMPKLDALFQRPNPFQED